MFVPQTIAEPRLVEVNLINLIEYSSLFPV